jgi:membrane-bound serine protease (ClpP class)
VKRLLSVLFFVLIFIQPLPASGDQDTVYVIPLKNEVEKGLYAFINRAVHEAEAEGAKAIILDIDTPGGFVDAADDIAQVITETKIKTVAFVNKDALSAGAYIALNADEIYMTPNASMGAAAVINQDGTAADQKAQSAWLAKMKSAAENGNRDPLYAMAMVDDSIDLPEYDAPKGKLLTLTAKNAEEVGYAEGIVQNLEELLAKLGLEDANVKHVKESFADRLARFITHPVIVPILLSLGSLGLIVELYTPGFGLAGITGLVSLLLFFYGHYISGLAGLESLLLFLSGVILVIAELFIPGGIAGFSGLGLIIVSILIAGENVWHMAISLFIAITAGILTMVIMMKFFGKKITWLNKLVLRDATTTEKGYVSNPSRTDLLGKTGYALTPLRPAGTVAIGNERIDAVTEGGFIPENAAVKVIEVEGVRVVVREMKKDQTDKEVTG